MRGKIDRGGNSGRRVLQGRYAVVTAHRRLAADFANGAQPAVVVFIVVLAVAQYGS